MLRKKKQLESNITEIAKLTSSSEKHIRALINTYYFRHIPNTVKKKLLKSKGKQRSIEIEALYKATQRSYIILQVRRPIIILVVTLITSIAIVAIDQLARKSMPEGSEKLLGETFYSAAISFYPAIIIALFLDASRQSIAEENQYSKAMRFAKTHMIPTTISISTLVLSICYLASGGSATASPIMLNVVVMAYISFHLLYEILPKIS